VGADLALAALILGGVWAGPRLIDGYSARQWARHHAARGASAARPEEDLRGAVRSAQRALERAAPLPWAAQAVASALELAQRLEPEHPKATLSAYADLKGALARTRASRWRGLGLENLAEHTAGLERAARARWQRAGP
jgi:hypothetical protein